MIQLFNHYVPRRLIVLAVLEALVLLMAAYIGISMDTAQSGATLPGAGSAIPSQAVAFALGMIIVMSSMGLYQPDLWDDSQATKMRMAIAFLLFFAITGLASNFISFHYQRPFALGASILAAGLLGTLLLRSAFRKWGGLIILKPRVLVLGTGSRVMKLAESAKRNPNHHVVGYVGTQSSKHYVPLQHVLPMGSGDSLLSVVEKHAIDQIVLGVRDRRGGGFPVQQLLDCRMKGVKVIELSTFFEREYRQVLLESLNPSWMVLGNGFRQGYLGKIVKRLFDLTASATLLVLALPIMLVTALCIYLESGLPVLYRQERVGQDGRVFTLYKFRSMRLDAESGGTPHWAKANDDRTTRVGRFIRKYRIDELPQIFNVLGGEMSFVGPRPERPFFVDQLVKQIPFYALRHSAKPGITGWAQVRYPYGATVDDAIEKLQYDLYYVKNHSLFLDLTILISTVEVVLWGKGAR
jgi:sugar transferase (PEP-CTERM system associated)